MNVIMIVGISGVGKSTIATQVADASGAMHLQASQLIGAAASESTFQVPERTDLRVGDRHGGNRPLLHNQSLLVLEFRRRTAGYQGVVLLDGHTLIDAPSGIVEIQDQVFAALGVSRFVFVSADPAAISSRRTADASRTRPVRSPEELGRHQNMARESASRIASKLGVPFCEIDAGDKSALIEIVNF